MLEQYKRELVAELHALQLLVGLDPRLQEVRDMLDAWRLHDADAILTRMREDLKAAELRALTEEQARAAREAGHPLRAEYLELGAPALARTGLSVAQQIEWCAYLRPWRSPDGFTHVTRGGAEQAVGCDDIDTYGTADVVFSGTDTAPSDTLPTFEATDDEPSVTTLLRRGSGR